MAPNHRSFEPHLVLVVFVLITLFWAPGAQTAGVHRRSSPSHEPYMPYQQERPEDKAVSSVVVNLSDPNLNQILTADEIRSLMGARNNTARGPSPANVTDGADESGGGMEK